MGRVLVVDDEPDVLLLCRLNLQQRGHELLEAADGSTALALARDRHPDVIVLDLLLPDRGGVALRADRERSHGLGASAFLTKPFLPNELCEMVDSLAAPSEGA